ncbi:hypothetical protein IAT38_002735 [Cryptococcus sp. DSM 104549]
MWFPLVTLGALALLSQTFRLHAFAISIPRNTSSSSSSSSASNSSESSATSELEGQKDGVWEDVIYTAGCDAQRANWPIQEHWIRTITLAAAWSGLNPSSPQNWTGDERLLAGARAGMDWWFENDYTSDDCIGLGGKDNATCPCGTPGLWNTNWFGQVILIPQLASTACLLVSPSGLSDSQKKGCWDIPNRAYSRRDEFINSVGYLTGANAINVMQNSVSMALYNDNATILEDALSRAMSVVVFSEDTTEDGIHRDGSFLQHSGILYSGNYGKDLINAFVQLEGEAIGTSFAANDTTRKAFAVYMKGSEWMIYVDDQTKQEHWDFNVVGRFIAFPTGDLQAISDINFNSSKLGAATADFEGGNDLSDTVRRLESNGTEKLLGNKIFWASDYMVHRRDKFVLTSKYLSTRTVSTEYTNSANPFGHHLGQGTLFSYVSGWEYRDIQAAWDWDLIPGSTTLLNPVDGPVLNTSTVGVGGVCSWVGGVSDGWVGIGVQDWAEPRDEGWGYKKVWFLGDEGVVVMVGGVKGNGTGGDVVSVLDQRATVPGEVVLIDGQAVEPDSVNRSVSAQTLYYAGSGYISYGDPFELTLALGNTTGNWSAISTSLAGNETVELFSAYTTHTTLSTSSSNSSSQASAQTWSYGVFPGSDKSRLREELVSPTYTTFEQGGVWGLAGADRLSLVFWPGSEGSATVNLSSIGVPGSQAAVKVTSDQPAAYLFAARDDSDGGKTVVVTLADPGQSLESLGFGLELSGNEVGHLGCSEGLDWDDGCEADGNGVSFTGVELPAGGEQGSSVFREVKWKPS